LAAEESAALPGTGLSFPSLIGESSSFGVGAGAGFAGSAFGYG